MSLASLVAEHRRHFQNDLYIERLVSRHPPTSMDLNTGALEEEPAAAIGMTVNGRLLRYVSHPEGYGADFPWNKARWMLRVECRRRHRHHRGQVYVMRDGRRADLWDGALCHALVVYVVIGGWSIKNAAAILLYDNPEPVLRSAFQFIEDRMDDFRVIAEHRAKLDEGQALICMCGHPWSRHDDPSRLFRCASCECGRYNADAKAA